MFCGFLCLCLFDAGSSKVASLEVLLRRTKKSKMIESDFLLPSSVVFADQRCIRLGVTAMLMIKPDELLVGSGDGNVCLVVDQTTRPSSFKKPIHDGIPKKIAEPTRPCLTEVGDGDDDAGAKSAKYVNICTFIGPE